MVFGSLFLHCTFSQIWVFQKSGSPDSLIAWADGLPWLSAWLLKMVQALASDRLIFVDRSRRIRTNLWQDFSTSDVDVLNRWPQSMTSLDVVKGLQLALLIRWRRLRIKASINLLITQFFTPRFGLHARCWRTNQRVTSSRWLSLIGWLIDMTSSSNEMILLLQLRDGRYTSFNKPILIFRLDLHRLLMANPA